MLNDWFCKDTNCTLHDVFYQNLSTAYVFDTKLSIDITVAEHKITIEK